jgi:predicted phosphodiesterase
VSRYAVISDVHGNWHALDAALAALEQLGVDRIIALGDLVGYNGESNECVARVRAEGIESIAGNHDLIALGRLGTDRCALRPAFTLRRTRRALDTPSRLFLSALPACRIYEDRLAVIHGTLDDPCEYMTRAAQVADNARRVHARWPAVRVCFFGHTHVPALWQSDGRQVTRHPAVGSRKLAAADAITFVNPGSIDAARRHHKVAELAIFDSARDELSFLEVPYDHEPVERSAAAKGFRMTVVDEVVWKTVRFAQRAPRRVARLVGL